MEYTIKVFVQEINNKVDVEIQPNTGLNAIIGPNIIEVSSQQLFTEINDEYSN